MSGSSFAGSSHLFGVRLDLLVLALLWVAFYLYWLISARNAKRNAQPGRPHALYRIFFIVIIVVLFRTVKPFRRWAIAVPAFPMALCGLILCALGLAFAVCARKQLGRNWGMPMSVKEDPELITSGPYRYVRHPIYSGILLAMLGSGLVSGILWPLAFVYFGIYFVFSARAEERLLARQFPQQYPAYRARTKALVPWVW